jgi:penicillin amidase
VRGPAIEALQGKDPAAWAWGKAHTLALCQSRCGAVARGRNWSGGFTLQRSGQRRDAEPWCVQLRETVRRQLLCVDEDGGRLFGDPDKIDAVLAGGVSERHFQPHQNDQAQISGRRVNAVRGGSTRNRSRPTQSQASRCAP